MAEKTKKETVKAEAENTEEILIDGKTQEEYDKWLHEKVSIRIFKDGDKYKDDVFVNVNGHRFQIQRGVDVVVPRYIAMEVRNSEEQDARTNATIEELTTDYKKKQSALE